MNFACSGIAKALGRTGIVKACSTALSVGDTVVSSNSTGISFQNSATSTGILNAVQLVNNGTGIAALGASSTGSASVTVQNSLVVNNGTIGILSGGFSAVMVANSTIAGNADGLEAQNAGAMLQVAGSRSQEMALEC